MISEPFGEGVGYRCPTCDEHSTDTYSMLSDQLGASAFGRLRQENHYFEASLGYRARLCLKEE